MVSAGRPARIRLQRLDPGKVEVGVVVHLTPIVALAGGVLILIFPRLLNYIVAIYLIVAGLAGLGIIH